MTRQARLEPGTQDALQPSQLAAAERGVGRQRRGPLPTRPCPGQRIDGRSFLGGVRDWIAAVGVGPPKEQSKRTAEKRTTATTC
jgi:hypothetical protein